MRKLHNYAQIPPRNHKVWKWQGWQSVVLFWATLKQKLNLNWNQGFFSEALIRSLNSVITSPGATLPSTQMSSTSFSRDWRLCPRLSKVYNYSLYDYTHLLEKPTSLSLSRKDWVKNRSSGAGRKVTYPVSDLPCMEYVCFC